MERGRARERERERERYIKTETDGDREHVCMAEKKSEIERTRKTGDNDRQTGPQTSREDQGG